MVLFRQSLYTTITKLSYDVEFIKYSVVTLG